MLYYFTVSKFSNESTDLALVALSAKFIDLWYFVLHSVIAIVDPIYAIIVIETIIPNFQLKALIKKITAMIISAIVGKI